MAHYEMLASSGVEILGKDAVFVPPIFNDNSRKLQAQLPSAGVAQIDRMCRAGQPVKIQNGVIGMAGTFCGVLIENTNLQKRGMVQFEGVAWVLSRLQTDPAAIGKFLRFDGYGGGIVSATCPQAVDNIGHITDVVNSRVYEVLLKSRCGNPENTEVSWGCPARNISAGSAEPELHFVSGTVFVTGSNANGSLAGAGTVIGDATRTVINLDRVFKAACVSGSLPAKIEGSNLVVSGYTGTSASFTISGTV